MYPQLALALLLLHLMLSVGGGEDDLSSKPHHYRERMFPHLLVRQRFDGERQSIAFLAQLRSRGGRVFNPFGDTKVGRCYRIVLLNMAGAVVHEIVSTTPSPVPDDEFLFPTLQDGLVGRCHWTDLDTIDPRNRPDDAASLPLLATGRYLCMLIFTARAFPADGWPSYRNNPEAWNAPMMSKDVCASKPVPLYLDEARHWWLDEQKIPISTFSALEVEPHTNASHDLAMTVWLVTPETRELVVPVYDLFLPRRDRALRWSVSRDDGFALGRFRRIQGGSYTHSLASHADIREIPRNGIVGGYRSQLGTFTEGGDYRVSVTVDESIFADTRFDRGKEMKPGPDGWKPAYRSPVVTVTIPDLTAGVAHP